MVMKVYVCVCIYTQVYVCGLYTPKSHAVEPPSIDMHNWALLGPGDPFRRPPVVILYFDVYGYVSE